VPIRPATGRHAGTARFAAACRACPLAAQCTASAAGRTITIGPHEAQLTAARTRQQDPARTADYRATPPKAEPKISHLMRRRHDSCSGDSPASAGDPGVSARMGCAGPGTEGRKLPRHHRPAARGRPHALLAWHRLFTGRACLLPPRQAYSPKQDRYRQASCTRPERGAGTASLQSLAPWPVMAGSDSRCARDAPITVYLPPERGDQLARDVPRRGVRLSWLTTCIRSSGPARRPSWGCPSI
jgi:hypothetical protein